MLTKEGRWQASAAGKSFGLSLRPFAPVALCSPASAAARRPVFTPYRRRIDARRPRATETLDIFLGDARDDVAVAEAAPLYDGTMQPEGSALFKELGYAPLEEYLERERASEILGAYVGLRGTRSGPLRRRLEPRRVTSWRTKLVRRVSCEHDRRYAAEAADLVAAAARDMPAAPRHRKTIVLCAHAIYLPAAALFAAEAVGCDAASRRLVLECNTAEAEGYLVEPTGDVSLLRRPR